ncbi:MAG: hypothetical protein AB4426_33900 [Xenococcaceae cyanobacterium]
MPKDKHNITQNITSLMKKRQTQPRDKGGRPRKYDELTERRSITATPKAWKGLSEIADSFGLNRSEFIEKLGKKEFRILSEEVIEIHEISIYPRLHSIISLPHPRFKSLLSLIRRIAWNFDLIKEPYADESLVVETALRSLTCIALRDFVYSGELISTHLLVPIKWLAYRRLLHLAGLSSSNQAPQINVLPEQEPTVVIWRIFNAIVILEMNYPDLYRLFKMRFLEGLIWEQIRKLLALRGVDLTEEEIRKNTGLAFDKLRQIAKNFAGEERYTGESSDRLEKILGNKLKQAQAYYNLTNKWSGLNSKDIEKRRDIWEAFLLMGRLYPKLDVLNGEIDNHCGYEFSPDEQVYNTYQAAAISRINQEFDGYLEQRLNKLKKELEFCGTGRKNIRESMMKVINEEIGTKLPEEEFLMENCSPRRDIEETIFAH